ncbi:MAG: hypothetical protein ABW221_04325 [Vicinamibacteria bacterium]
MRSPHVSVALFTACLAACGAPPDALVSRCSTPALSVVSTCQLTAQILRQERSAFIDGGTSTRVQLKARFEVKTGQVTIALPCVNGRFTVTPDEPLSIECEATVDRGNQKIRIDATPATPGPQGLSGTLELRPL